MLRALPILVSIALAAPALAATTIQQDFDAAQALLDAGKATEARTAFTALLSRFSSTSQSKAASLVRARLANALLAVGEPEAAEPLLTAALPGLKGTSARDVEEYGVTLFDLGRAQESQGKLDSAAKTYAAVADAKIFPADDINDLGLRAARARTLIWSNPDESRRLLDAMLALPREKFGTSRDTYAQLETLRGRVELNNNNPVDSRRWFTKAASTAGGALTTKVSVADVRIRGDLALANYKMANFENQQRYVAFSGAGSLLAQGMSLAADTPLPSCAPVTGLAPDAVAVIEFSIDDTGRVVGVTPIYADTGAGSVADHSLDSGPESLFTQAVRRWSWVGADISKLDSFWRQAIRIELRCFTTRSGRSPVDRAFNAEYDQWVQTVADFDTPLYTGTDAADLPAIRAEVVRREARYGEAAPQLVLAYQELFSNNAASLDERLAALKKRTRSLVAGKAPPSIIMQNRVAEVNWAAYGAKNQAERLKLRRDGIASLLAEQEAAGTGDTRIANFTRLELAEALDDLNQMAASRVQLDRIIAAPEANLPDGDPIRTAALLRKSNQAAAARDSQTAASALAATGLSPEQCSLIDIRPQGINNRIDGSSYPDLVRRWSTDGYARIGYDITAEGKPVNVRTIAASPPFVFGAPTVKAVSGFRYKPVFRPGNTIGCTGNSMPVRWMMKQ